jgi:hypothetical protein
MLALKDSVSTNLEGLYRSIIKHVGGKYVSSVGSQYDYLVAANKIEQPRFKKFGEKAFERINAKMQHLD